MSAAPLHEEVAWLPAARAAALGAAIERQVAAERIVHGIAGEEHPFRIDAVPRIVDGAEWDRLAAGLAQRARALEAFAADVHGPRTAVADGVVPADVVQSSVYHTPGLPAPAVWIAVAGPDVVRAPDGALVVLEDNVRTPTMMAYALAARRLAGDRLDAPGRPRPVAEPLLAALREAVRCAAPDLDDPLCVVLSDGPQSVVRWELDALGALLGWPVARVEDLGHRAGRLVLRDGGRPVDVVWRRTSEERLQGALGAALGPPVRAGTVRVVNAFGSGVADDKRVFPYVEDLVRHLLGEEPLVRSVPAYDLGHEPHRRAALDRLGELVVKPRNGSGGFGVLVGPSASRAALEDARTAIAADPGGYVAQEHVAFSTHATLVGDGLAARHADLRPFACRVADGSFTVPPAALARFARDAGDMVVNCSQGGGGKDVWVLDA